MHFNPKKAKIFRAVKWGKLPFFRWSALFEKLFLGLFGFGILLFVASMWLESLPSQKILGASIIILVIVVLFWLEKEFFEVQVKRPDVDFSIKEALESPDKRNIAELLSFSACKAVSKAINKVNVEEDQQVNSNYLFYFLLKYNSDLRFVFSRAILDIDQIKKILKKHLEYKSKAGEESTYWWSTDFEETILKALKIASEKEHHRIRVGDIIAALSEHNKLFKEILIERELKSEDVKNLVWWLENIKGDFQSSHSFWEYENLAQAGTIGRSWAAGYTVNLDKYSHEIISEVKRENFKEIVGHQDQFEAMERVLDRSKINNVLLVGRPGVGRRSIVKKLAKASYLGTSLPSLNYGRVIELDLSSLLAQLESVEKVESTLDKIFKEVALAGNVILVIPEFHNYVGRKFGPGRLDISGILSSYLKLPQFRIVAISSYAGLHKNIQQNPSLLKLMGKVEVPETSVDNTIKLLQDLALRLEQKYDKFVTYPALREIVSLSEKYMPSTPFPKKALDLLDEIMVFAAQFSEEEMVLPKHVNRVISEKTEIPVGKIQTKEKEMLLNLEELIHKRIVNQDPAVNEIASALRRSRTEVTIREGPIGAFLFMGPTGVGKTETSKALASIYFGSESRMIRLDMSEFQSVEDMSRLIGTADREGLLTTPVSENPFSLVLLDEIEKAHPNILNLFLQILDEGFVTDGMGRKVNFRNTMIIATSNAGAEVIWKDVRKDRKMTLIKEDLFDKLFQEKVFSPEFINRFDEVVLFTPLTRENLIDISELLLSDLVENLDEKDITFIITEELKEKIAELGYSPEFGAREMRRVIQEKVENPIAEALLGDKLKRGDTVKVDPEDFSIEVIK